MQHTRSYSHTGDALFERCVIDVLHRLAERSGRMECTTAEQVAVFGSSEVARWHSDRDRNLHHFRALRSLCGPGACIAATLCLY